VDDLEQMRQGRQNRRVNRVPSRSGLAVNAALPFSRPLIPSRIVRAISQLNNGPLRSINDQTPEHHHLDMYEQFERPIVDKSAFTY